MGPGGTFWQGRSDGDLAVRYIEFGNETDGGYQFNGCGTAARASAQRAQQYALRLKDAQEAIDGSGGNPSVGLLAISDDHGATTWADNMYQAVPDLNNRVAGWTEHPYGPNYKTKMNNMLTGVSKHGGGNKPIFVTEFGISTDNGRCLSDNYGWPTCLTYSQAATDLHNAIADLHNELSDARRAVHLRPARHEVERVDQRPRGLLRRPAEHGPQQGRLHRHDPQRPATATAANRGSQPTTN